MSELFINYRYVYDCERITIDGQEVSSTRGKAPFIVNKNTTYPGNADCEVFVPSNTGGWYKLHCEPAGPYVVFNDEEHNIVIEFIAW